MVETPEIKAILRLIDDPDQEVYDAVQEKIVSFGRPIIPNLENLWENAQDLFLQERIERIIHCIHFEDLKTDWQHWLAGSRDLLQGAILVSRYHYPALDTTQIRTDLEKIRRNVWLELNSYLTAMEKIHVMNSVLFDFSKISGEAVQADQPERFFIHKVLETHTGNKWGIGLLYLILCEQLDLPVNAIAVPEYLIFGYQQTEFPFTTKNFAQQHPFQFYLDPQNGQMYSAKDVEHFLQKKYPEMVKNGIQPLDNAGYLHALLIELSNCFQSEAMHYKYQELRFLASMLAPEG